MKDLDFDEIDQAVNSLKPSTTTESDKIDTSVQPNGDETTNSNNSSQTLAKRRSSGQFMDVVHPSSNMRRAPLISHERPSIPDPNLKPTDKSLESSENVAPVEVVSSESSVDDSWPDPIDFQKGHIDNLEDNVEPEQKPDEDADIDQISDDITNELSQKNEEESPDSPFISGTKVEKRPLGAFSTEPMSEKTEDKDKEKTTDESKDENKEDTESDKKPDEPLPEELQDDLLLIESGEESTSPVEKTTPTEAPVIKEEVKEEDDYQSVGPTSITQQYKEQPSTGEQSTGAIYNTDAYHKPLVKPAKSKSSWMWILWILILIIVGVSAGVAIYLFVIPLL